MLKYFHATTAASWKAIRKDGKLRVDMAKCKQPSLWFHVKARMPWAMIHTVSRHGGVIEDVVVLEVRLKPSEVKVSQWEGLVYTLCDIPARRVSAVFGFREVSRKAD